MKIAYLHGEHSNEVGRVQFFPENDDELFLMKMLNHASVNLSIEQNRSGGWGWMGTNALSIEETLRITVHKSRWTGKRRSCSKCHNVEHYDGRHPNLRHWVHAFAQAKRRFPPPKENGREPEDAAWLRAARWEPPGGGSPHQDAPSLAKVSNWKPRWLKKSVGKTGAPARAEE